MAKQSARPGNSLHHAARSCSVRIQGLSAAGSIAILAFSFVFYANSALVLSLPTVAGYYLFLIGLSPSGVLRQGRHPYSHLARGRLDGGTGGGSGSFVWDIGCDHRQPGFCVGRPGAGRSALDD